MMNPLDALTDACRQLCGTERSGSPDIAQHDDACQTLHQILGEWAKPYCIHCAGPCFHPEAVA